MTRAARRIHRPGFDPLEGRIALSDVAVVGGTLSITGTPGHDRILIGAAGPGMLRVALNGKRLGRFGPVARIAVDAGGGNDTVLLGPRIRLPAVIRGGAGDDHLRGGSSPDQVFGDDGDDTLVGTRGRDALDGGQGSNRVLVPQSMGSLSVGPSASGEALRLLSKAYTLRPLGAAAGPMIVGAADLGDANIAARLKAAYEAGNAVALTDASAADAERLRALIGHPGGVVLDPGAPHAALVVFRKAPRPDGQTHFQSSLLQDRPTSATAHRRSDENRVAFLSRFFAGAAVVPGNAPTDGGPPNLVDFANSYESSNVVQDSSGDQIQLVNTAWSARAFMSGVDYYYVKQEVDYFANVPYPGALTSWFNETATSIPSSLNETLFQTNPGSTMETTSYTNSVAKSISETVGVNESQGLNASTTVGVTIADSKTYNVPPVQITNRSIPASAIPSWSYQVNELPRVPEMITFNNEWFWVVPFGSYSPGQQSILVASEADSDLRFKKNVRPDRQTPCDGLPSMLPLPFGDTFALQQPVVGSVSPTSVEEGEEFTINGSGMYPSLVTGVLVGGVPLAPGQFTTVSDTQITVVAPDQFDPIFGQSVVVQTTLGISNDNVTIIID